MDIIEQIDRLLEQDVPSSVAGMLKSFLKGAWKRYDAYGHRFKATPTHQGVEVHASGDMYFGEESVEYVVDGLIEMDGDTYECELSVRVSDMSPVKIMVSGKDPKELFKLISKKWSAVDAAVADFSEKGKR